MGESTVTVVDVARAAGVSPGTVSRVMNGREDVAPEIRREVLEASRRIGFVPRRQHRAIAVVADIPEPLTPLGYAPTMVVLLTRHLNALQFTIELVGMDNLELAHEAHVQGVLSVAPVRGVISRLEMPHLPILSINEPPDNDAGVHSVCTDHFQQGKLATEHLLAHGHRRIAFLESSRENWGSRQRRAGYEAALTEAGVQPEPALAIYAFENPIYDSVARVVRKGTTALLNASEHAGLEVLHLLTNILRLSIPKDISVVTMEHVPVCQYFCPPQTVVRQPVDELARLAAEHLVALASLPRTETGRRKAARPIDITLPCELIERESVAMVGA